MLTLLAAILVFGVLITVHEAGHFFTAKLTGMQVDEFAVGMGPAIYQTESEGTKYSLRLIPLGGYNKIAGMEPGAEETKNGFASKSIPARLLVILAGSLMNFILPVLLFFGIFLFSGLDVPVNEPVVGTVIPQQAAALAGIMPGDRILSVNGVALSSWQDMVNNITKAGGKEVTLEVDRAGSVREYKMTPVYNEEVKRPLVGISPQFTKQKLGLVKSAQTAVLYEKQLIVAMVTGLLKLISGSAPADVVGPVGIVQIAGNVASQGIFPLLNLIAVLSINLAIINLLPIPALDGGHLVVILFEAVRGKPLATKYLEAIQMVGIAIIIGITVIATFKDITR